MEKIKQFMESEKGKDILVILVVILVGLGSFELGRLSKNSSNTGVKIEYTNSTTNQNQDDVSSTKSSGLLQNTKTRTMKNFFASNRGSKYYPAGCTSGQNIVEENRIYFTTSKEAEQTGYELSSSCK